MRQEASGEVRNANELISFLLELLERLQRAWELKIQAKESTIRELRQKDRAILSQGNELVDQQQIDVTTMAGRKGINEG